MALRSYVLASLPLGLAGASAAPGCGCEVSHCCSSFNGSRDLRKVFDTGLNSSNMPGYTLARDTEGYSAACSLLNLIPGWEFFEEGGGCSHGEQYLLNRTVCEAIDASEIASDRLHAGRSIVSVFTEPGTCAELQGDACWESRAGYALYQWDSFVFSGDYGWCEESAPQVTPALAMTVSCDQEGSGLSVSAKWIDNNGTDSHTKLPTSSILRRPAGHHRGGRLDGRVRRLPPLALLRRASRGHGPERLQGPRLQHRRPALRGHDEDDHHRRGPTLDHDQWSIQREPGRPGSRRRRRSHRRGHGAVRPHSQAGNATVPATTSQLPLEPRIRIGL